MNNADDLNFLFDAGWGEAPHKRFVRWVKVTSPINRKTRRAHGMIRRDKLNRKFIMDHLHL